MTTYLVEIIKLTRSKKIAKLHLFTREGSFKFEKKNQGMIDRKNIFLADIRKRVSRGLALFQTTALTTEPRRISIIQRKLTYLQLMLK